LVREGVANRAFLFFENVESSFALGNLISEWQEIHKAADHALRACATASAGNRSDNRVAFPRPVMEQNAKPAEQNREKCRTRGSGQLAKPVTRSRWHQNRKPGARVASFLRPGLVRRKGC